MRMLVCGMVFMLSGCGGTATIKTAIPPAQQIVIHDTKAVYPPENLYADNGNCKHAPRLKNGATVRMLANALVDERLAVDECRADRAAIEQWVKKTSAK